MVAGIGQAAKTPQYISANSFCGLHGRALPAAISAKIANNDLTVVVESGDGDTYGEGGNHFIHNVRRNVDISHFVHDNQIYGLTKGQFSPTTLKGRITKSSPYGTIEEPFRPAELTFGARGTFFGRLLDVDLKNAQQVMLAAAKHKGTSVIECLVNCVIFNDGAHSYLAEKTLARIK